MYAISTGKKKTVQFYDSSSDEECSRKKDKRNSKKTKKKTSGGCGALLYPIGPVPLRFPPGVARIYPAPQPVRPIFAAHVQVVPVAQPVVPCSVVAVTHTQLYPSPAFGTPSTNYVLQPVNQTPAAVPVTVTAHAAAAYPAMQSPFLMPVFTG